MSKFSRYRTKKKTHRNPGGAGLGTAHSALHASQKRLGKLNRKLKTETDPQKRINLEREIKGLRNFLKEFSTLGRK